MKRKKNQMILRDLLKNSNEYIREIMKKGIPGKDQKKMNQKLTAAGVTIKPEEFLMAKIFFAVFGGFLFYFVFRFAVTAPVGMVLGFFITRNMARKQKKKKSG